MGLNNTDYNYNFNTNDNNETMDNKIVNFLIRVRSKRNGNEP